jgi:hypothetical protein
MVEHKIRLSIWLTNQETNYSNNIIYFLMIKIVNHFMQGKEDKMAGWVMHMGEMRNVYQILDGMLEGNRPLRRPGHRWEDDIKIGLWEIGIEGVDWIHLAPDRD